MISLKSSLAFHRSQFVVCTSYPLDFECTMTHKALTSLATRSPIHKASYFVSLLEN